MQDVLFYFQMSKSVAQQKVHETQSTVRLHRVAQENRDERTPPKERNTDPWWYTKGSTRPYTRRDWFLM